MHNLQGVLNFKVFFFQNLSEHLKKIASRLLFRDSGREQLSHRLACFRERQRVPLVKRRPRRSVSTVHIC